MKSIKIFIASSDELTDERRVLADLIGHLNKLFKPRGFEIDPEKWEWLDASMGPKHKQEEYNEVVKTCDICLVLFWTKFGEYTAQELDTAYGELCAGRKPTKIYVYFKDGAPVTPELQAFKDSFDTHYGHFYCRFENTDTLNLNFVLQLEHFYNDTISREPLLKIRNAKVVIDDTPIADLQEIPFAGNNPAYLHMLKDIETMQAKVLKYPEDLEFRQELHDLQERRKQMEESLLDTAKFITRLSTQTASTRLQEAIRLFEAGDNMGANAVLNLKEISEDTAANARRIDRAREMEQDSVKALETNIEEYYLKIKALQNAMEPEWVSEIIAIYTEAIEHARGRISPEKFAKLLSLKALFLCQNKQHHLVGTLYDEALALYRNLAVDNPDKYKPLIAFTLHNLASWHHDNKRYAEAEGAYQEALSIRRRLAEKKPEAHIAAVAATLHGMANMHDTLQKYTLAEQEYQEAFAIRGQLAEINPQAFDSEAADTLHNMAILHKKLGLYRLAEDEYRIALSIYRRLATKNPEDFDDDVAWILNGLAVLHDNSRQFDSAEAEYQESLTIRRRLAEKNPESFQAEVADTLNNLAILHQKRQQYQVAEREYQEALATRRQLAEKNPEAFEAVVADTLNNLALLYDALQQYEIAEHKYQEALSIRRRLAVKAPEAFDSEVALTLNNLANLHQNTKQYDQAHQEYQEAMAIYRRLTQHAPEAFDLSIATTRHNHAVLFRKMQQYSLAEQAYQEELAIRRRLATKSPEVFEESVADTLVYLANLYYYKQEFKRSKSAYIEAVQVYRHVAQYNPAVQRDIAQIEEVLAKYFPAKSPEKSFWKRIFGK